jgi:pimeloyl-ACP methyl ester carboxylesterase
VTGATVTSVATPSGEARLLRRPGRGPTLLLVHCCGGNEHTFDLVLPYLDDLDVVVPALPGRSGSAGAAPESAEGAARWVIEVARAAGLKSFIAGGYSYGGAVALECALLAPEVVGLALISTGARLRVSQAILAMADQAVARGEPLLFGDALYQPGTPAERRAASEAMFAKTPPEAARADWRACDAFDRMKDLGRIQVPALVVSGTADVLTPPRYAAFLAGGIAGARLVSIEGGGHALPVDKPEELGASLVEFTTTI